MNVFLIFCISAIVVLSESLPYGAVTPRRIMASDTKDACKSGTSEKDEVHESFKLLFVIGDKDLELNGNNDVRRQHCRNAESHLKLYDQHVECIDGAHKVFLKMIGDGFKKAVNKRCNSRIWRRHRGTFVMKYILRYVSKEDQLRSVCCALPFLNECVRNGTENICSRRASIFILDTMWDPFADQIQIICNDKFEEWCDHDPKTLHMLDRISSTPVKKHDISFYHFLLQIIENHFESDSE